MERLTDTYEQYTSYLPKDIKGARDCYNIESPVIYEKLGAYEDLEEQGLLIRLPCEIGREVYIIDNREIVKGKVDGYKWWRSCGFCLNVVWDRPIMEDHNICRRDVAFKAIRKTVFLTYEEAEQKLKELQKECKNHEQIS